MTEEEFLGYEEEPVYEEKQNFFEAIADNPKVPIFAFLGLVIIVAIVFGVVSIFSGSGLENETSSISSVNQPKINTPANTPDGQDLQTVRLPQDKDTLTTAQNSDLQANLETSAEEAQHPEALDAEEEASSNTLQEAQAPKEESKQPPMPEYKAIKVDHKENIKVPITDIKIESKAAKEPEPAKSDQQEVAKQPEEKIVEEEITPKNAPESITPVEETEQSNSSTASSYDNIYQSGNYRKLTPELMNELIKSIDYRFQKIGKQNNKCIEMNAVSGNDRAYSYAKEVQSFLRGQGYDVSTSIKQVYLTKPVQDVWVWFNNDCVSLTVGTPKY